MSLNGHIPTPTAATVLPPDVTVTDGDTLDVEFLYVWGIDGDGDPYYNAAGVTAGDEAVLAWLPDSGDVVLRPVEVT